MNIINNKVMRSAIKYISLGLLLGISVTSCSDKFLEDKKNYDNVDPTVYNSYTGARVRLNDIYSQCVPWVSEMQDATINKRYTILSCGLPDMASRSTEEYAGSWSDFVNPNVTLVSGGSTGTSVPDFFMGKVSDVQQSIYGRIRNVNDFLKGVEDSELTQEQKNELLGQAHFFRAWLYYNLVKWYGGVPLVKEVQNPEVGVFTPRSSTKECIQFIVDECNLSSSLLAPFTTNGGWDQSNWGRVTSGTALALKGRALLLWASPLFNRNNVQARWTNAYNQMKADLPTIQACGYHLFSTSSNVNGSDFALQFMQTTKNPEAVFVVLHNSLTDSESDETLNNPWEGKVRPSNTGGSGLGASAMLADLFPMADGKLPSGTGTYLNLDVSSTYSYDKSYPFMNRDPRFYRTFAFPGVKWVYSGDPTQKNSNNPSYNNGRDYVLWNYVWYTDMSKTDDVTSSAAARGADNFLEDRKSIYVRKKSDDGGIPGASQMYTYIPTDGFTHSAAPLIELRYAEVLLNLAEAAAGAGDLAYAHARIKEVRDRAGVPMWPSFSSQEQAMSAVLYERQVEFAYEGKRFDDMRRWMLWDGGATQPANTPSTYKLNGWGGNTCTWLGVKPFNGQRRERIEFQTAKTYGAGGTLFNSDPLLAAGVTRDVIVDVNKSDVDLATQCNNLKAWYQTNLYIIQKRSDPTDSGQNPEYITFNPKYYILGLKSNVQENNKDLPQTVGWEISSGGSFGTFDPLSDVASE